MKKLKIGIAILVATLMVSAAFGIIFWSRTIHHPLTVIGINAEILKNTALDYKNKVAALDVDTNNKVLLTIYQENFYNVWLNLTFTSTAEGLNVTCLGQYVTVDYISSNYVITPTGTPFEVMGYSVVDKTKMMYETPDIGISGGALQLTFTFDTELVLNPGDHTVDLLFEMGFA